eukprot:4065424-Pyramimonas_sp.AAC.1
MPKQEVTEPEVVGAAGEDPWAAWGGAPPGANFSGGAPSGGANPMSGFTLEAFERMLDDPVMSQMLLPNMPEGMRDPQMIKMLLQNPQARAMLEKQFAEMASGNMDPNMMNMMNNYNMESPEVKAQFEQMGVSPNEVMQKIMQNPELAAAFQNPRIQAAIMDCSQNPMNISKYQNDSEIMDTFMKINSLFPGMGGPMS